MADHGPLHDILLQPRSMVSAWTCLSARDVVAHAVHQERNAVGPFRPVEYVREMEKGRFTRRPGTLVLCGGIFSLMFSLAGPQVLELLCGLLVLRVTL